MRITRSKAIRLKCLDCTSNQPREVTLCPSKNCPLWNYRFGYEVDDKGNRITRRKGSKNAFLTDENLEESEDTDET